MLFIIASLFVFGAVSIWAYRAVAGSRTNIRIPVRVIAGILAAIALPVAFVMSFSMAFETASHPKFSPNGRYAVRVLHHDEGGTGGGEVVEAYWSHGFRSRRLLSGGWQFTNIGEIDWQDDRHLLVKYAGESLMDQCKAFEGIEIVCVQRNSASGQ